MSESPTDRNTYFTKLSKLNFKLSNMFGKFLYTNDTLVYITEVYLLVCIPMIQKYTEVYLLHNNLVFYLLLHGNSEVEFYLWSGNKILTYL